MSEVEPHNIHVSSRRFQRVAAGQVKALVTKGDDDWQAGDTLKILGSWVEGARDKHGRFRTGFYATATVGITYVERGPESTGGSTVIHFEVLEVER